MYWLPPLSGGPPPQVCVAGPRGGQSQCGRGHSWTTATSGSAGTPTFSSSVPQSGGRRLRSDRGHHDLESVSCFRRRYRPGCWVPTHRAWRTGGGRVSLSRAGISLSHFWKDWIKGKKKFSSSIGIFFCCPFSSMIYQRSQIQIDFRL